MNETDQRMESARFADLVRRAARGVRPVFSAFLTPDARARLAALARREGLESGDFGAAADAERAVVGLWQPGCAPEEAPIAVVSIAWDGRYAAPQHRDVLGACLGLGLQRETLGDIRLEGDCAYVAATPAIADYLIENLHEVGRAKVSLSRYDGELPAAESGRSEVVNVPSLRLDAVLAQTLHLSRARAQALIRGGAVQKNWQITDRTDAEIAQGDVLSIRGSGRIRVHSVQGESRKGRLFLEVETFLRP